MRCFFVQKIFAKLFYLLTLKVCTFLLHNIRKAAHRMLVKLPPEVNFTNILDTAFCYTKVLREAFLYLHIRFVLFVLKNIDIW
jgi:hypothetical protein